MLQTEWNLKVAENHEIVDYWPFGGGGGGGGGVSASSCQFLSVIFLLSVLAI